MSEWRVCRLCWVTTHGEHKAKHCVEELLRGGRDAETVLLGVVKRWLFIDPPGPVLDPIVRAWLEENGERLLAEAKQAP